MAKKILQTNPKKVHTDQLAVPPYSFHEGHWFVVCRCEDVVHDCREDDRVASVEHVERLVHTADVVALGVDDEETEEDNRRKPRHTEGCVQDKGAGCVNVLFAFQVFLVCAEFMSLLDVFTSCLGRCSNTFGRRQ